MGLSSLGKYDDKIMNIILKNEKELNRLYVDGCKHLLKLFNLKDYYDKYLKEQNKKLKKYIEKKWITKEKIEGLEGLELF